MWSEEPFLLKYKDNLIQGDPRLVLKKLEKEQLAVIWKAKAPKQAMFIKKHLVQILNQSQRVWKWSIEANDGKAWIYFIFATCQWLPVNRRTFYNDKSPYGRQKCQLCLSGEQETIEHMWKCPAFASEQVIVKNSIKEKLIKLNLPFAKKQLPNQVDKMAEIVFEKNVDLLRKHNPNYISKERFKRMARDFWSTNKTLNLSSFKTKIVPLLLACQCGSGRDHVCGYKDTISIRQDLMEVLCKHLSLNIEANTTSLGRSTTLSAWCSVREDDVSFGSLGPFWKADLLGRNCLFVCSGQDQRDFPKISEKINMLVNSKHPTRILLIIPTQLLSQMDLPPRKILQIALVPRALPLIRSEEVDCKYFDAKESYSITLALNQESMLIDPIQWDDFKKALGQWAEENCSELLIPDLTDNLFTERIPLPHPARAVCKPSSLPSGVYHFFDFTSPKLDTNHMLLHGIPVEDAKLIAKNQPTQPKSFNDWNPTQSIKASAKASQSKRQRFRRA